MSQTKKKLEKKEKGKLATANVFPRQARVEKKDKREIERIKPHQTFSCINQSINQRMIYYHTYDKLAPHLHRQTSK